MSLPRPPKAVVFDMDGLLIDSESVYRDALLAVALDQGLDLPEPVCLSLIGHAWPASATILVGHFGDRFDPARFRIDVTARFQEIAHAGAVLKSGVVEILDRLDELALPYAIVTSSDHKWVRRHVGGHGLLERFHAVLAQGDYACSKPAPDPYLKAAQVLGLEPRHVLALEDSHNGVRAAAAAGMMTIMVPDLLDPTQEMHDLCIRIARDLHEVRGLLA